MNKHEETTGLLPFYINGTLEAGETARLEAHLQECAECQAELAWWQQVGEGIAAANQSVQAPALRQLRKPAGRTGVAATLQAWWTLVASQARLLRGELWIASPLVLGIGVVVSILLERQSILYGLAPLVAAAGISALYGRENDPAMELVLSTPYSQTQLLLARLGLVSGYDLLLTLAGSLVLNAVMGALPWQTLVTLWLAPLAFMSGLALLLSMLMGTGNAISVSYGLWLLRYFLSTPEANWFAPKVAQTLAELWASPQLLLVGGVACVIASLLYLQSPLGQSRIFRAVG